LIADTFGGADTVVAWLGDADGTLHRTVAALGVKQAITAPGRPAEDAREHVALYLLRTLAPLGLPPAAATPVELGAHLPRLHPSPQASATAERCWDALGLAGRRVVALHPGSGGANKRWPPNSFAALADSILARSVLPLVIEGPADGDTVREVLAEVDASERLAVLRDVSVDELAGVLARCVAHVGNDSGVTHLAALLGVPTLALFGPTDPVRWSPIGQHVRVLRANDSQLAPMSALSVERVEWALAKALHLPEL
jgi:ADP-heptose:LPS heptosyltransferase